MVSNNDLRHISVSGGNDTNQEVVVFTEKKEPESYPYLPGSKDDIHFLK